MNRTSLAILAGLATLPAQAQSWTAPVKLGPSTGGPMTLVMNASGDAMIAFAYAPANVNGTIALSQARAGQPWPAATYFFSASDANDPGIALADDGSNALLFNTAQIDNLSGAVLLYQAAGFTTGFTANATIASNVLMSSKPLLAMTQSGSGYTPVFVYALGCKALRAGSAVNPAEATLTTAGDCATGAALAILPGGSGAVIFRTKTGLVRAASRLPGGSWTATTTLGPASTLAVGSLAAAGTPSGDIVLAWTRGTGKTAQLWTAVASAAGSLSTPQQINTAMCNSAIGLTSLPDGTAVLAFARPGTSGACEAALVQRPSGASFGAPAAVTVGAHVNALQIAATAQGRVILAWNGGSGIMVAQGLPGNFSTPIRIGPAGTPALAARGGYATVAWCGTACFVTASTIP